MSPVYNYIAKSKTGDEIKDQVETEDFTQVARQLRQRGYFVVSIEKTEKSKWDLNNFAVGKMFNKRVKISDLAIFSRQFAVLIDAGIPLVDALEIVGEQTEHHTLKEVLAQVQEDVETGSTLSDSLLKHTNVFPPLYCQMIRAGETGGMLDRVLNDMADHYEHQNKLNEQIKSALYYPVTFVVIGIVAVSILVTVVIPTFVTIFEGLGADLPLPTKILIGISTFLQQYWWFMIGGILVLAVIIYFYNKKPDGKYMFDRIKLKLPVMGDIFRKIAVSRFARTYSFLISSGVNVLNALKIVEDVVGNRVIANALEMAERKVKEGGNLSQPLEASKQMPRMVTSMLKIGEETGDVDVMLDQIANFYDQEVKRKIDGAISLIEPILIILMAVVVGFIAVSVILPIFNMYTLL
ncbi:MAG: type II secretion system F family protein [Halanaerobium sp.]|nr:type II secretion system F family protein [Halanaerobium sp.]